jgi:hypothetical protein
MERGGYELPKVSLEPLPCGTHERPAGGTPMKQLYGRFRGGPPIRRAACGVRLSSTPLDTPRRTPMGATTSLSPRTSLQQIMTRRPKTMTLSSSSPADRRVWQGVSTDSLKFHPGLPNPSTPPKRPISHFWDGPSAGRATCGLLLPPWIPHAVRPCYHRHQRPTSRPRR